MAVDRRTMLLGITAGAVGALTGCTDDAPSSPRTSAPRSPAPTASSPTASTTRGSGPARPTVTRAVAENLTVPWGIAFLRSGDALVTERDTARILRVRPGGRASEMTVVPDVDTDSGEGGLLGIALSADESTLFAYYTSADDNRVVRMRLEDGRIGTPEPILTSIPRNTYHNGGGLLMAVDGLLYVTTGDAGDGDRAQDRGSRAGKILRIDQDGSPAPGNPFENEVWSYGHRNVEGIAFGPGDRLWASEFGDQETDEMNLVERGANYGWPQTEGRTDEKGISSPKATWSTEECSPSGIAVVGGAAYLGALRGECLWQVPLSGADAGKPRRHLRADHGRIRSVVAAPGGGLWITTSNTDGRADPGQDDDRILQVSLSA